jgi:hypothetical protein
MKARNPHRPNPHTKKQRYQEIEIDKINIFHGVMPKNFHGLLMVLISI